MKISPIINFNYRNQSLQTKKQENQAQVQSKPTGLDSMLPSAAVYSAAQINFGENCDVLKSQLLALDDVHCPGCGKKMLSDKTIKELVKEAGWIRSLPEYARFLTKNKDYFHPQFKMYIDFTTSIAQTQPEKTISDVHGIQRSGATKIMLNTLNNESEYLNNLLNTEIFSKNDREKIKECIEYLKSNNNFPKTAVLKENLLNTLGSLENDRRWEIYTHVKKKIQNVYSYQMALRYNPENSDGLTEHAYIVRHMLNYSKSNLTKVYMNVDEEKRFNNMLICSDCVPKYATFKYIQNSPDGYEKIRNYVNDIADNIADNKLVGNNAYLYEFMGAVNSVSKGKIHLTRKQVQSIAQDKVFKENKSHYMFENYEGIPCACCGTETITHQQKLKIYKEINECENLNELINLSTLYSNHLTKKGRVIHERLKQIFQQNPDVTEDEMFKSLQTSSKKDISDEMQKIKKELLEYAEVNKLGYFEKEIINDFLNIVKKRFLHEKPEQAFRYDDYDETVSNTLGRIGSLHSKKLIVIAKRNIKSLYIKDLLVHPAPNVVEKTGSKSKAMMQNIFKMSVLTVDHISAKTIGGKDNYSNKIGYCKDCNNEKSGIRFNVWATIHPEINENLPKHLKKIAEIIKHDYIRSMRHYPENAAKTSMRLAAGKLNIPTKYDTLD